jgi:hypothetical protein
VISTLEIDFGLLVEGQIRDLERFRILQVHEFVIRPTQILEHEHTDWKSATFLNSKFAGKLDGIASDEEPELTSW